MPFGSGGVQFNGPLSGPLERGANTLAHTRALGAGLRGVALRIPLVRPITLCGRGNMGTRPVSCLQGAQAGAISATLLARSYLMSGHSAAGRVRMLKLTVAVLAFALAGFANAAGWRSLRVDGSSEEAFNESVALLKDKLSPSRRHAFDRALQDIRARGAARASAEQREYTSSDYHRQLDGLSYDEVVRVLDPSGRKAKQYRAEYYNARSGPSVGSGGSATFGAATGGARTNEMGHPTRD